MKAKSFAYNTRRKSPAQLEQELVGAERWDILDSILKELALEKNEPPKQHWLITGPRGIGKSHLLTLLYYKVKSNDGLSKQWITVLFPEELRMASDLAKFLERTVSEILVELERDQNPFSAELKKEIIKTREIPAAERSDYLFNLLNWIHQTTGRFILLIIENLQQLLGKKISEIEQKKLRAFLQTHDSVLMISSATSVFNILHDHKQPFYHFFHIKRLNDMTFDEMKSLIANLMGESGNAQAMTSISTNEARLKAIHSFTGGNPRMAVFLSEMLKTDVPDEMLDFMDQLLDELNPYFEAILNDTPDYMEEVMNTLAIFEPAQSPKEIADHLEAEQSTIRNYLKQMKDSGYVRVAFSKGNSNFYCLNEYLYRIWYQMRDSSHREETRWIMELLMMLYSPAVIADEKMRMENCLPGIISVPYKELIYKTVDFMDKNPDYCRIIEWCVEAALKNELSEDDEKKKIKLAKKAKKFKEGGKYTEAINIYQQILRLDPNEESAYGLWGLLLVEQGLYEGAIEKFKKAIEINPNSATAYWSWGHSLRRLKQYENAIEKLKKALEIKPNYAAAYGAWGDCLRYTKRFSEAEEKYRKALEINPEYEDAYRALGRTFYEQKRYGEAILMYKKALQINPKSANAYWGLGACLRSEKQYNDAINNFKKVVEIDPKDSAGYGAWGDCLHHIERYDEAEEKYNKAIEVDPNYEDAYLNLSQCFAEQKRYNDAIETLQKLLKINGQSVNAYGLWGAYLGKQKQYDKAAEKFKKALDIDSESIRALSGWIRALVEGERYDEAIALVEKQNEIKDCLIILYYGTCLLRKGRYNEAIRQFNQLLNIHHDCGKVYMLHGEALEKLGNKEKALLSYLTHIGLRSTGTHIYDEFRDNYDQYIAPILSTLESEGYIKHVYSQTDNVKLSMPQVCTLLLLMDRFDIVADQLQNISDEFMGKDEKERVDFDVMIFSIKFKIWLTLTEEKIYESLKLAELFSSYVKLLKTEKEKEDAVSEFILGIFKLQAHFNIKKEYTFKILETLKKAGVPFSEILFKVWKCLSEPDSVDAQRHLADKAIAKLVEQIRNKESARDSVCGM
ncbi:MAG: tetratricopeptide repeat protein [Nitrospirae bacterium]|nr:tetratricopeptide repeat protein [Nitrospirota bacterium]